MNKDKVTVYRDDSDPLRAFGKKLHEQRKARGISQSGLAERAGTTQSTIAYIEAGTANPTVMTLNGIAVALNLDLKIDFSRRIR